MMATAALKERANAPGRTCCSIGVVHRHGRCRQLHHDSVAAPLHLDVTRGRWRLNSGGRRAPTVARPPPERCRSKPLQPPPALHTSSVDDGCKSNGKDPMDDFLKAAKKPMIASVIVDNMAVDVQAAADVAVATPLEFDDNTLHEGVEATAQLDVFSPTLSAATTDCGQFNRATSSAACTPAVQLGAMTSKVCQLEIDSADDRLEPRNLFRVNEAPLVASPPARWPSASPKSHTTAAPTRHITRQAANPSTVPVAQ
ncbi:hypothetical protein D1007_04536 [Hordeum vulgare]|nr:hypothetical protein D1007_04536 [Hordeum vulgare]